MSSTFDDSVFDFDLNFLNQSAKPAAKTNIISKAEKQRRAVLIAKKKAIATDSLIRKFYDKKEVLEQTERDLATSKDQCRQVCVDYKNLLEKYGILEQKTQQLEKTYQELQSQYAVAQNQYIASQSHINQLQVLVKEYEDKIETMKQEPKLELKFLENKNKLSAQRNINDMLKRHINLFIEVAVGKTTLNDIPQDIFKKYQHTISQGLADVKLKCNELTMDDDEPMSPHEELIEEESALEAVMEFKAGIENSIKNADSRQDLDEVFSSGRGSSLAFSDNEKCLQSPEYYLNGLSVRSKGVSVATSPIPVLQTTNRAVSPIVFENHVSLPLICIEDQNTICSSKSSPATDKAVQVSFDSPRAVSETIPITEDPIILRDSNSPETSDSPDPVMNSVSPLINLEISSPIECANEENNVNDDSESKNQEKECLELNNSKNICNDHDGDFEVETILDIMRWKQYKMITPIPPTPVKNNNSNNTAETETELYKLGQLHTCNESNKIREENKVLHAGIALLAKEIMNIKSILKTKLPNDAITLTDDFEQDLVHKTHTNKHINIQETSENLTFAEPTEDGGYSEDLRSGSIFDEPSKSPSQQAIIEEECQDTLTPDEPTIHSRLQFEDEIPIEECNNDDDTESLEDTGPDLIICHYEDASTNLDILGNEKNQKPKKRIKKLTKLEKIRRRLVPKGKIAKLSLKSTVKNTKIVNNKLLSNIYKPKKISESDDSSTLNDKKVYEKALRVMTDLKSKQKKQLKAKKKTVLNREIEKPDDSIVNTNENALHRTPLAESKDKDKTTNKFFETVVKNDLNNRLSRSSSIPPKNKMETENLNNCHCDSEDNRPKKLRRRGLKRAAELKCPEEQNKRVLRSSVRQQPQEDITDISSSRKKRRISVNTDTGIIKSSTKESSTIIEVKHLEIEIKSVEDLKNSSDENSDEKSANTSNKESVMVIKTTSGKNANKQNSTEENKTSRCIHPKDSILCKMIEKHANLSGNKSRKAADTVSTLICNKITESVAQINVLPADKAKHAMDEFVLELQNWKVHNFLSGFMQYLKNPERKVELFNKITTPPAPTMTKSEQILLYIVVQLNNSKIWKCNVINNVLDSIEFTLFQLNQTPEFDIIESMSHFYAVLCRYAKAKSRLRLFMMNAMYCIQFKSIPLIKQCTEVWMHIIPVSSTDIAKSPLVIVLVYLLHFYKCEDRFKRVSEIRTLLYKKYFYNMSEWNDYKILELLKKSIKELRDIPIERKMMRLAIIIISKRLGVRWCQENIIKKLLLPLIEKDIVSEKTREFCVSVLGPLLKPYPPDMKVHCEIIVNQMLDMLEQNPSPAMEEAIFTSLIYINRHNPNQVIKALTTWSPQKVSSQLEDLLKDFIQTKPVKGWKFILSKLPLG